MDSTATTKRITEDITSHTEKDDVVLKMDFENQNITTGDKKNEDSPKENEEKTEEEDPLENAPLMVVLWFLGKSLSISLVTYILDLPVWKLFLHVFVGVTLIGTFGYILAWLLEDFGKNPNFGPHLG